MKSEITQCLFVSIGTSPYPTSNARLFLTDRAFVSRSLRLNVVEPPSCCTESEDHREGKVDRYEELCNRWSSFHGARNTESFGQFRIEFFMARCSATGLYENTQKTAWDFVCVLV